jgi:FKBP-type peptidyl-prolyl cis-trans isomerase
MGSVAKETWKMRRSKFRTLTLAVAVALGMAGGFSLMAPSIAAAQTAGKTMTTPSGLQIIDSTVGTGAAPKPGQICVMHYTGWLYEGGKKGKKFDSSVDRNEPLEFPIGQHKVIAGWDEGVATMKVGGKRTLIIPPALGYGARGAGGVIPPNATLIFDVELLDVKG